MVLRKFLLLKTNLPFLNLNENYIMFVKKFIIFQFFFYKLFNSFKKTIRISQTFKFDFYIDKSFFICKIYKVFLMLSNFLFLKRFSFFNRFMFCISVGLGFRKKIRSYFSERFLIMYMGTRHWLAFRIPKDVYIFPFKRGSLVFFSKSKYSLIDFLKHLQHVRRELVFKIKGFYLRRRKVNKKIGRTWAFARRVKFRKIKTKLSKKQKFI